MTQVCPVEQTMTGHFTTRVLGGIEGADEAWR